jgi:hypothetical protein
MTPAQAKNALAFLARANMNGGEVPAYMEVVQALTEIAQPKAAPTPLPDPTA